MRELRRWFGQGTRDTSTIALFFGLALGVSGLALPLVAVAGGYDAAQVGVLYSFSAVSQVIARIKIGALLRLVPDRTLVTLAAVGLSGSYVVVLLSPHTVALGAAWALQGFARGFFWTGSQTHVVRKSASSLRALASLNTFGAIGLLLGPIVAGVLTEIQVELALLFGAFAALVTLLPIALLERFAPFEKVSARSASSIWRIPGVGGGAAAAVIAGAWRGLMESVIPVVLEGAGHLASATGAIIGVANGAGVGGASLVGRLRPGRVRFAHVASIVAVAVALAALGIVAPVPSMAGMALLLGGFAAGALQTLAPAVAAASVSLNRRGDAIATVGLTRTISASVVPLVTSVVLSAVALAPALILLGACLALPALTARSLPQASGPSEGES